jgi:ribonucleoside-triphosphate reductase
MPYCFAYDLSRLATEGLFFIDNYNNEPPKHLQTFLDDVIEYISFMSNRSSGAAGVPDIIIWMFYFWKKDVENGYYLVSPDYYLRQAYQKLIFRLNQKFYRDQTQTVFSNMSIFDRVYLEELFGGREYPDGTFVIDYI